MNGRADLCVVGGGPAGIATALAARQHGMDVVVADSMAPPIDKPCGEGLMPDSLAALQKLGVTLPATEGFRFRGIRFASGEVSVEANFPFGLALGVRRTYLHQAMADQAESAGVRFLWRSVVTGLEPDGIRAQSGKMAARWIVGADGGSSRLRRWAGLDRHLTQKTRFAFRRHYRVAPWSDFMELHWGPGCQLYVTPISPDEVCVVLISRDRYLHLDAALQHFPLVARKLAAAQPGSTERGAVSTTRKLARVSAGNVALVGDASGGVDAITGEGMCLAFRQASVLAQCLAAGDLAPYQPQHRALARRPTAMASLMLVLERPWLRGRVMQAFARRPHLFAGMLATHVGATSVLDVAANGLNLGWELLRTS